ncbi:hypothetical protein ANCDUO_23368, partial [Ancylostoma duodenale]
ATYKESDVRGFITRIRALTNLLGETRASRIVDRVHGATQPGCDNWSEPALFEIKEGESMYKINGQNVTLSKEQRKAVVLDTGNLAIVGIQAAFWTGNTVVGVNIAARRANAGKRVLVTANTDAAVARLA